MHHPYYFSYAPPPPVLYVLCPSNTPSPVWSFSTQASLPTPAVLSKPLPPSNNHPIINQNIRSPPPPPKPDAPKPKVDDQAAEPIPLRPQPRIDPLIVHSRPAAESSQGWDLYHDIRKLRFTDARKVPPKVLSPADFAARPAVRAAPQDGSQPLRSLVLIFPKLLFQIEVKPSHSPPKGAPPPKADFVSDWDVLTAIYDYLRKPVDGELYDRMSGRRQDALCRAGAQRLKALVEDQQEPVPRLLRNIDLLGRRHRFNGIRVAQPDEVPKGRQFGEVFVVEVSRG
ncbi:hypothetical protein VTO73DRAFT_10515 [Trametes versicolor]